MHKQECPESKHPKFRALKLNHFDFTILLDNGQNYTSCQLSMSKSQLENYLYFSCYGDLQTRVSWKPLSDHYSTRNNLKAGPCN